MYKICMYVCVLIRNWVCCYEQSKTQLIRQNVPHSPLDNMCIDFISANRYLTAKYQTYGGDICSNLIQDRMNAVIAHTKDTKINKKR